MRKTYLFLLLFAGLAASAQVSINTNLTTGTMTSGVTNIYRTAYLHFQLVNCGDNTPIMPGTTNGIVQDSFDLHPSTPGSAIVGQIVGNDQITCGNVVSSYYVLTPMKDASHPLRDGEPFVICSAAATITTCGNQASLGTFNIITADPMQQPPPVPGYVEIYGNPTNDQTINQPINGFNGWTGLSTSFTFTNGLILGPVTTSQLSSLTGYTNIVMTVDSVVGSNPCAGGGTGALAIFVNGAWDCNIGSGGGGGGGPGTCTQYDIAYWLAGSPSDALGCLGGISGYVPLFQNGAVPIAAAPGLVDSPNAPVSTTPYGIKCDDLFIAKTTVDRGTTIPLVSGASVVNIPVSSGSGCHGMAVILENDNAGPLTVNATSPDLIRVLNGSSSTGPVATSFTFQNGQWVSLNQSKTGLWTARINTGNIPTNPAALCPATAQPGDICRFNVNGDSLWDAVNATLRTTLISWDIGTGEPFVSGAHTQGTFSVYNNIVSVLPTTTYGSGAVFSSAATASTSTIGTEQGSGGNFGTYSISTFYRWTFQFAAGQTTNVRYWMGLGTFYNGGTGANGAATVGSTAYATNTPNKSTTGFRYSAGTDTTWQACAVTATVTVGAMTCQPTGVSIDTNPHLFEMTTSGGTTVYYFIDHALVATVSSNVQPPGSYNALAETFWTADNQNTANAVSGTFYWIGVAEK